MDTFGRLFSLCSAAVPFPPALPLSPNVMSSMSQTELTASLAPENGTNGATALSSMVTEAEAALYDRQIRLWGLEAQNRLRTSHILILNWDGVSTEIIKNTVLSGVGHVTIVDSGIVDESIDMLSSFFFRESDVGQPKCSNAPLDRIRALNPLVKVDGVSEETVVETLLKATDSGAGAWIQALKNVGQLVVTSDTDRDTVLRLSALARRLGIKFFFAQSYGLGGCYFVDQLTHDYIVERPVPGSSTGEKKRLKNRQAFVPLEASLAHSWHQLTDRQKKRVKVPLDYFTMLAYWDLTSQGSNLTPQELLDATRTQIVEKGLMVDTLLPPSENAQGVAYMTQFLVARSFGHAVLSPIASVLGGILSQDLLNSIGAREEPIVNWLFLELNGNGSASVHRIGDISAVSIVA